MKTTVGIIAIWVAFIVGIILGEGLGRRTVMVTIESAQAIGRRVAVVNDEIVIVDRTVRPTWSEAGQTWEIPKGFGP